MLGRQFRNQGEGEQIDAESQPWDSCCDLRGKRRAGHQVETRNGKVLETLLKEMLMQDGMPEWVKEGGKEMESKFSV